MAIQQTKKQSDLEKRLKLLRTQVYGRSVISTTNIQTNSNIAETKSDVAYLYQDLLKIAVLSSIALGIQIVLYFSKLF